MDSKKLHIPLTIILVLISLYAGFYMSTATAFPQNPSTYQYFNKIAEMPHVYHEQSISTEQFWREGGDCTDRAQAFREYLESRGATNIQMVRARYVVNGKCAMTEKKDYGHDFLIWNGRVYNPSLNTTVRIYDGDLNDYKVMLKGDYYKLNMLFYENGTSEWL